MAKVTKWADFDLEFAKDRLIWDKQPNETAKAFFSFSAYRDIGVDRSIRKLCQILGEKPGYRAVLERWSAQWRWVDRADAWDRELDRIKRQKTIADVEKMRQRHIKLSEDLQALSNLEIRKLIDLSISNPGKNVLSPNLMLQVLEVGVKLERLTRGETREASLLEAPSGSKTTSEQAVAMLVSRLNTCAERAGAVIDTTGTATRGSNGANGKLAILGTAKPISSGNGRSGN